MLSTMPAGRMVWLPFLHVMRDDHGARQLYAGIGFRDHLETVVRVLAQR